jgi:hypothetical protein
LHHWHCHLLSLSHRLQPTALHFGRRGIFHCAANPSAASSRTLLRGVSKGPKTNDARPSRCSCFVTRVPFVRNKSRLAALLCLPSSSPTSLSLTTLRFQLPSDSIDPARIMDRPSDAAPDGSSPRTFAINHVRPKSSFQGCSRISDYELQGKLGEGTFGYDWPFVPHLDSTSPKTRLTQMTVP